MDQITTSSHENEDEDRKRSLTHRFANAFRSKSSKASSSKKLSKRRKSHSTSGDDVPPPPYLSRPTTTTTISSNNIPTNPSPKVKPPARVLTKQKPLQHGAIYRPSSSNARDEQTGEFLHHRLTDDTELLHSLGHRESSSSLESVAKAQEVDTRPPGEPQIASLPSDIWLLISTHLSPLTCSNLAISSKTLFLRLTNHPWTTLNLPVNKSAKIDFLLQFDSKLPLHLLCFSCVTYHLRSTPGTERLRPTSQQASFPVYKCPFTTAFTSTSTPKRGSPFKNQRVRITPGNTLPFTFVQLALRAHRYGPSFGIPLVNLERRWRDADSGWSHQSRYIVHKGRLLMRITSKTFAAANLPPSGQRYLLYSREDYTPYFSVCAHWRDGELMRICKCALGHIPERRESVAEQLKKGPKIQLPKAHTTAIVSLCGVCRPMRRCTDCATEYLVELKLAEDREGGERRFRQAIVVTRWSDLGDGRRPDGAEWSAVCGDNEGGGYNASDLKSDSADVERSRVDGSISDEDDWDGTGGYGEEAGSSGMKPQAAGGEEDTKRYDSFAKMGRRAISGIFESQSGVTMPGQRMLSLNPKGRRKGENGNGWY